MTTHPSDAPGSRRIGRRLALISSLLALLGVFLALHSASFSNRAFILSPEGLLRNPFISNPKLFGYLFTRQPLPYTGYEYKPVSLVFVSVWRMLLGESVFLWHLLLLTLHFANACMLCYTIHLFTEKSRDASGGPPRSAGDRLTWMTPAVAAAIFLFLPVNLIFVNNPDLIQYPLSMMFSLASLLALQGGLTNSRGATCLLWLLVSFVLFVLAMMSSYFAVMVVVLACLLPGQRRLVKLAYAVLGVSVLTVKLQVAFSPSLATTPGFLTSLGRVWAARVMLLPLAWSANLARLFCAWPSSFFLSLSSATSSGMAFWLQLAVHLVIFTLGLVIFLLVRQNRFVVSGLILLYVSPLFSFLNCRGQQYFFGDEFLYFAGMGVALIVAGGWLGLWRYLGAGNDGLRQLSKRTLLSRTLLLLVGLGYVSFLAVVCCGRQGDFATDLTFWQRARERTSAPNGRLLLRLGDAYFQAGLLEQAADQYGPVAYGDRYRTLKAQGRVGLGLTDLAMGNGAPALAVVSHLKQFYGTAPSSEMVDLLYWMLLATGRVELANPGELDAAEHEFAQALEMRKWSVPARIYIADILYLKGYVRVAVATLEDAYHIDPSDMETVARLTLMLRELQDPEYSNYEQKLARKRFPERQPLKLSGLKEVAHYYRRLRDLHQGEVSPGELEYFSRLATGRAKLSIPGRLDAAEHNLALALRLREDSVPARIYIADVLYLKGYARAAVQNLKDAYHLNPSDAEVLGRLAFMLWELQDPQYKSYEQAWAKARPPEPAPFTLLELSDVETHYNDLRELHQIQGATQEPGTAGKHWRAQQ